MCTAKEWYLWFPPFQSLYVPQRNGGAGSMDRRLGDHWYPVWSSSLVCTKRCQEAGGLFLGKPPGLCYVGFVCPQCTRHRGWHTADGQPWIKHGSVVPYRWYDLRAQAHA